MGVASGCGEQEAGVDSGRGWNLWVGLLGVVVMRHIDFLILLIPIPLVSVLFAASLLFVHKKFFFFILVPVFFVIKLYVLNKFFIQYKHTYAGRLRASHSSHMKSAHNVLYTKKHIQKYVSYPAMDISCI